MFKEVSINQIKEAIRKVISEVHPERIILFGSYACGKPNADSDVDLLLVISRSSRKDRQAAFLKASNALDPRPFPVDLIVRSESEIQSRLNQGDFFLQDIFEYGQVLYQR